MLCIWVQTLEQLKLQEFINVMKERCEGDSFVHAAAKLIGQYGVPEYEKGGIFMMSKLKENNELDYYKEAVGMDLARQVGSHYYAEG